jgi:hypothetical protein
MSKVNPIVSEVLDVFDTIKSRTTNFIKDKNAAQKGLMIAGDAGMGKTTSVIQAILACKYQNNVEYVKGSNLTAPSSYVKFYLNRGPERIIVLDDVDVIHKGPKDRSDIIEMIKAATEPTIKDRFLGWERANDNSLMKLYDVPRKFKFEGRLIWITNNTMSEIEKATKSDFFPLMSRLNPIKAVFSKEQKLMYTIYLITEKDMLGKSCDGRDGGYPQSVQLKVIEYLNNHYRQLREVTPRVALLIADTIQSNPKDWKKMLDSNMLGWD